MYHSIRPGQPWLDTNGKRIQAHGGSVIFIDGTYYFYGENKEIHKICGSKSGRDCDKTALTGLTPVFDGESVYFDEARLVLVCKKQYIQAMDEACFTDKEPLKWFPNKDFHHQIYGKIEKVLVKE